MDFLKKILHGRQSRKSAAPQKTSSTAVKTQHPLEAEVIAEGGGQSEATAWTYELDASGSPIPRRTIVEVTDNNANTDANSRILPPMSAASEGGTRLSSTSGRRKKNAARSSVKHNATPAAPSTSLNLEVDASVWPEEKFYSPPPPSLAELEQEFWEEIRRSKTQELAGILLPLLEGNAEIFQSAIITHHEKVLAQQIVSSEQSESTQFPQEQRAPIGPRIAAFKRSILNLTELGKLKEVIIKAPQRTTMIFDTFENTMLETTILSHENLGMALMESREAAQNLDTILHECFRGDWYR